MKKQWAIRLGASILLAMFGLSAAHATQGTLVADAYTINLTGSTNRPSGSYSNLNVNNYSTAFLRFTLGSLPLNTTSSHIAGATLRLYVNRVNQPGTMSVAPVNGAWDELKLTAANQPALGAVFTTFPIVGNFYSGGYYVTIDVTAQVRAWVAAPSSNCGLAIAATPTAQITASADASFDARENDLTASPAVLDITFGSVGPAGAQGPQGIQGVRGAAGAQGTIGLTGPQGLQGIAGLTGPTGTQGVAGLIGATGLTGLTGSNGANAQQV